MTTGLWVLLLVLSLVALWLAWRYIRLVLALRRFEATLRAHDEPNSPSAPELEPVSHLIRQLLSDDARHLSLVSSERDKLAAVLDQLADGVLIADSAGEIQYSNPAASELFEASSVVDRTVTEVLRDHRLVEAWRLSVQNGGLQSASVELPTSHRFIQLVVVPDTHGGGSLLLAQDLTRVRRLETVRQDFVSNVSHELRTPLASLRALAETLMDGAARDPQAGPRFFERMIAEVDALTQMAQELLDLASIESGQAGIKLERIAACRPLEAAADRMRIQVERAGLALHVDCPDSLPPVLADEVRIGQVLVNLIHNAIKFTKPNGRIVLTAGPSGETSPAHGRLVEYTVTDTGAGISADDLPRIFERFYRTDKARSSGGTGLGLSIARHIVEAHGGRIWAESIAGHGSSFHFTVPLAS